MNDEENVALLVRIFQNPDRPTLRSGDSEPEEWIRWLQEGLEIALGWRGHRSVDFDDDLENKVESFQRHYGLEANGMVTDVVWDTLAWALTQGHDEENQRSDAAPDPDDYNQGWCEPAQLPDNLREVNELLDKYDDYRHQRPMAWDVDDQELFRQLDRSSEWEGIYQQWYQDKQDSQLVMYEHGGIGHIDTRRDMRERIRRATVQRALDLLTNSTFGAIAYGTAKGLGADEETAQGIGGIGQGLSDMGKAHRKVSNEYQQHYPGR